MPVPFTLTSTHSLRVISLLATHVSVLIFSITPTSSQCVSVSCCGVQRESGEERNRKWNSGKIFLWSTFCSQIKGVIPFEHQEVNLLVKNIQDISFQLQYLQSITLTASIEIIELVVTKMSDIRSLTLCILYRKCSDFSFLQACPNLEVLSILCHHLEPNHCQQFSHLKKLIAVDLQGTCLTSEAMLVLLQSLSATLRRFRHGARVVMSHFDVVVHRFPYLEEFSVRPDHRSPDLVSIYRT